MCLMALVDRAVFCLSYCSMCRYTDDLPTFLDRSGYGCRNQGSVNHLYYADDMVLISPTPFGFQKLLNICEAYARDHDILFNKNLFD